MTQDNKEPLTPDEFIQELTTAQGSLRAYILASLGNISDTSDVLQRTNLALWKNASNYTAGTKFLTWALTLAKFEILSFCRDRSRDRHVYPEDLAALMLDTARDEFGEPSDTDEALRRCLEKLSDKQNDILRLRYYDEQTISQMAVALKRTENAVKAVLVRIRRGLQECIERRLKSQGS